MVARLVCSHARSWRWGELVRFPEVAFLLAVGSVPVAAQTQSVSAEFGRTSDRAGSVELGASAVHYDDAYKRSHVNAPLATLVRRRGVERFSLPDSAGMRPRACTAALTCNIGDRRSLQSLANSHEGQHSMFTGNARQRRRLRSVLIGAGVGLVAGVVYGGFRADRSCGSGLLSCDANKDLSQIGWGAAGLLFGGVTGAVLGSRATR